jgi:hypothetical protein
MYERYQILIVNIQRDFFARTCRRNEEIGVFDSAGEFKRENWLRWTRKARVERPALSVKNEDNPSWVVGGIVFALVWGRREGVEIKEKRRGK